jgi:hypothetical protein
MVLVILLALGSVLDGALSSLSAKEWVGTVAAVQVTTHDPTDATLGDYYTFSSPLPAELAGREIRDAVLECYVDVNAREVNGYLNDSPMLQLFILELPLVGEPEPAMFRMPSPAIRNVPLGLQQKVVLNVRDLVTYIANAGGGSPPELIMGSLTGTRDGKFILRTDVLPEGDAIKVIIWYR